MIRLPVSRRVRSGGNIEALDFSIPQGSALERSGRQQQRATLQPVDGTDIMQPSIPPSAMSLSKRRRFTGCVTSKCSPYRRFQKAARTPSLWAARSTRSFEKKVQEEATTIREARKKSSTRCFPKISSSRAKSVALEIGQLTSFETRQDQC